jgi:chromosome segregation ATPase
MSMRNALKTCLLMALALPAVLAAAEDAPKPTLDLLSREQIEQCLRDRQDVVALNRDLTVRKAQLDQRGAPLSDEELSLLRAHESLELQRRRLLNEEDSLKKTSDNMNDYLRQMTLLKASRAVYSERIDQYNSEVRAHKQLLDQYNADVLALNVQLDSLDAKAHDTDRRCVKTPVKRADLDAAKAAVADEKPRNVVSPAARIIP